jgi:uncharacterized delta-60 repeat protein
MKKINPAMRDLHVRSFNNWLSQLTLLLLLLTGSILQAQTCRALEFTPPTFGSGTTYATGLAVFPDNSILLGGRFNTPGSMLIRLNNDGSPDTIFNANLPTLNNNNDGVRAIHVQPGVNGKILIGGDFTDPTAPRSTLLRLNSDGTLDNTFNSNLPAFNSTTISYVQDIYMDTDNSYYVGGGFTAPYFGIVHINADGTIDNNFAPPNAPNTLVGQCLSISPIPGDPTKLIIGGALGVRRIIKATGQLDNTFTPPASSPIQDAVYKVKVLADGKILVGTFGGLLKRLNPDGTDDITFTPPVFSGSVRSITVLSDDKLIVTGSFNTPRTGIVRLNSDGSLDNTFEAPALGVIVGSTNVFNAAELSDGLILAAGNFASPTNLIAVMCLDFRMTNVKEGYCPGSTSSITYQTNNEVNPGNVFSVQLSDANGSFASPMVIGSRETVSLGRSLNITIPSNTPSGSGYRLRIVGSDPAYTSPDNGFDIAVGDCPANTGILPALWLRADVGVTQTNGAVSAWADQSGSNNNHLQDSVGNRPGFSSVDANFNPSLTFNGSQWVADTNGILSTGINYDQAQVFLAHNSTSASNFARGLYGQYVTFDNGDNGRFMAHGEFSDGTQYFGIIGGNNSWVTLPAGADRMNAYVLNTYQLNGPIHKLWFNGGDSLQANFNYNYFVKRDTITPWAVGTAPEGGAPTNPFGFRQKGAIPEIIVFREALSQSNQYKVETYLGIKYGTQLLHNYYSSAYNGANDALTRVYDITSYGNNIAGIARDDDYRLYQKQSRSQNSVQFARMVTMGVGSIETSNALNTNSLDNNLYLVWGDDGNSISENPLGSNTTILNRVWKLQATGQPSAEASKPRIQVNFDLTDANLSATNPSQYQLIIDRLDNGGNVSYYAPDPASTASMLIFKDVVWDTDNSGSDLFSLLIQQCTFASDAGTIAGDQTICPNTVPAAFTSSAAASGQVGVLQYRWQQSTTSAAAGFTDIANSDAATYAPAALSQTTWFRRLAGVDCFTDWTNAPASNVIQVTAIDVTPPVVNCSNTTVTFNGQASMPLDVNTFATANDNCAMASLTPSSLSITCAQLGQIVPITVTATDVNGNSATCISQVSVQGLPCGWRQLPDGVNCANGNNVTYNPATQVFTVNSTNCHTPMAAHTADGFAFAQRTLCGNGSLQTQVTSINGLGWGGIVMRESNAAGSKKVHLLTNRQFYHRREVRNFTGGLSHPQTWRGFDRYWLRLVRIGIDIVGYISPNGVNWTQVMVAKVPLNSCIEMGLITHHSNPWGNMTTTFANVSHTGNSIFYLQDGAPEQTFVDAEQAAALVFPNPSNGQVIVDMESYLGDKVSLQLTDMYGRQLQSISAEEVETPLLDLDLSAYPTGVYLLQIKADGKAVRTERIIRQ